MKKPNPVAFRFEGDDETPNNSTLPVLVYRDVVPAAERHAAASWFEDLFARHGWADGWRNGIHPFLHFHTGTHEVLGIASGRATVQFGGAAGRALDAAAGMWWCCRRERGISVSAPAPTCWSSAPIRSTAASTRSSPARWGEKRPAERWRRCLYLRWTLSRARTAR